MATAEAAMEASLSPVLPSPQGLRFLAWRGSRLPAVAATWHIGSPAGQHLYSSAPVSHHDAATLLSFVVAVIAIGLTVHPIKRGVVSRWIALVLYVVAAELLLTLTSIPRGISLGAGIVVIFGVVIIKVARIRITVSRERPASGPTAPPVSQDTGAAERGKVLAQLDPEHLVALGEALKDKQESSS